LDKVAVCWKEEDDARKHYMTIEEEVGEGVQAAFETHFSKRFRDCWVQHFRNAGEKDGNWTSSHNKAWLLL